MVAHKRLIAILLACVLATTPVYADNGKMGKHQKTKEEIEIEKAEHEEKIQCWEMGVGPVNVEFKHGKYSLKPSKETSKRGQQESSRTNYCIVADIRYGKMAIFVYKGGRKHRALIKKSRMFVRQRHQRHKDIKYAGRTQNNIVENESSGLQEQRRAQVAILVVFDDFGRMGNTFIDLCHQSKQVSTEIFMGRKTRSA